MKWQEQHEAFKREAIRLGIGRLEEIDEAMPFGCDVPKPLLERWINRLSFVPTEFSSQRRYVNRFKIGADPEFIFVTEGERCNAQHLKLAQGLAFGMDNNGRLTEIRPYPSRSVVESVASILTTLRWLAVLVPKTLSFEWHSGAFLFGDGLGGHVHFGRKRPGRDIEVKALDAIDDELLSLKCYPLAEVKKRRDGDQHNQHYGLPGDYRKQRHGYEYRTFPSWLDSPELAFLTMTLSKLAVQNPRLVQGFVPSDIMRHVRRIKNLLAYYKDVDDDARLALMMLSRKIPVHIGKDFRSRWGLPTSKEFLAGVPEVQFIPACIKPDSEDIKEVFDHLLGVKSLSFRVPKPTWSPLVPLSNYTMVLPTVETYQAKGLGELLFDVVQSKDFTYKIQNSREGTKQQFYTIPGSLAAKLPKGWEKLVDKKIRAYGGIHDTQTTIYSLQSAREASFDEARRLLLETVFPYWTIDKVKPDSWEQWKHQNSGASSKRVYFDEVLCGDLSIFSKKFNFF